MVSARWAAYSRSISQFFVCLDNNMSINTSFFLVWKDFRWLKVVTCAETLRCWLEIISNVDETFAWVPQGAFLYPVCFTINYNAYFTWQHTLVYCALLRILYGDLFARFRLFSGKFHSASTIPSRRFLMKRMYFSIITFPVLRFWLGIELLFLESNRVPSRLIQIPQRSRLETCVGFSSILIKLLLCHECILRMDSKYLFPYTRSCRLKSKSFTSM